MKIRYDLKLIANLVNENSRVLDIGCGDGELLEFLCKNKKIEGRGLEISQTEVSKAISKGLSIIQGDAEDDLAFYSNNSFDYAILSQTIQATKDPKKILEEMLRIAKFAIVSLPNFANIQNRIHLLIKGTMPVNKNMPFEWYETPNIHFCSISDFEILCKKMNFHIEKKIFLTKQKFLRKIIRKGIAVNIFAEYGIFVIKKL